MYIFDMKIDISSRLATISIPKKSRMRLQKKVPNYPRRDSNPQPPDPRKYSRRSLTS